MGRLIDSDDVKELLMGLDSLPWEEEVDDLMKGLPTVEAAPVVHGEWLMFDDKIGNAIGVCCSVCGIQTVIEKYMLLGNAEVTMNNFCPNCGADMRKKV